MDEVQVGKDDSITGENVNLIDAGVDENQPVDISPDVPDAEEEKQGEDEANIEDDSPQKQLINQVDIPSLVGSVVDAEQEYQRAKSEKKGSDLQEFAEFDAQPDRLTNLDREGLDEQDQDHDGYSQVQEFVNEAPDLDLPEDDGMIGFDDFQDDFKQPELDQTGGNQLGEDMFNDFNSDAGGSASIRALTIKDGVNYEDAAYDELAAA